MNTMTSTRPGSLNPAIVTEQQPEIFYEVGQLRFTIEQLEGAYQALCNKLAPVVAQVPTTPEGKGVPIAANKTMLGGEIRAETQRLETLKGAIIMLSERIEM